MNDEEEGIDEKQAAAISVTTDFRAVFSPLLTTQLGLRDRALVSPGWTGDDAPVRRT